MKLQDPFIQLPLKFDSAILLDEINALGESAWRPHPEGFPGNSALTLITTDGDPDSNELGGAMRATPYLEKCPYLMQVLGSIDTVWGRTRLMRLSGHAEVSPHVDINYYWHEHVRVHVPITTQPTVRFICGENEINMAAGECWIFDTWRLHRVINDAELPRIHLVADTVGSDAFWRLVNKGNNPLQPTAGWMPQQIDKRSDSAAELRIESSNLPKVMTPWEMRQHFLFLLSECAPDNRMAVLQQAIGSAVLEWRALWAQFGESEKGWPFYRRHLDEMNKSITIAADQIRLRNGALFIMAARTIIFGPALADRPSTTKHELRENPAALQTVPGTEKIAPEQFADPVFIISPPRSGSSLLFETLAQAANVYTIGGESHAIIEQIPQLAPESHGFDSNCLDEADATPEIAESLRLNFWSALRDRQGNQSTQSPLRMLEKTPKNALRIPFIQSVFPNAKFIYLYRKPEPGMASMMEAWRSGRFRTYPQLPGWSGLPWSMLLVPGWRDLIGKSLEEIVATQWATTTRHILDALEKMPKESWQVCIYEDFIADPDGQVRRLCKSENFDWDLSLGNTLPLSRHTLTMPNPDKWKQYAEQIESVRHIVEEQHARALRLIEARKRV